MVNAVVYAGRVSMSKRSLPKYLGLRYNTYYVAMEKPKDTHEVLGKSRFWKSLQTDSLSVAESRKWQYVDHWKSLIKRARSSGFRDMAEAVLEGATDDLVLNADGLPYRKPDGTYLTDRDMAAYALHEAATGNPRAVAGVQEATGEIIRLDRYLDDWSSGLKKSTKNAYTHGATKFLKAFEFAHDITRERVTQFFRSMTVGYASKKVYKAGVISLMKYIDYHQGTNIAELIKPDLSLEAKAYKKVERQIYGDADLAAILKAAPDDLRDLVLLQAYTGARIGELTNMPLQNVKSDRFTITDSKTTAGLRDVPIHTEIRQLVARLVDTSENGLLLPFSAGTYRAKFNKLKDSLPGLGEGHVPHAWRNTVASKLLEAGVPEPTSASILGHKINTMTYGTYAKGSVPFTQKAEAIEKVRYSPDDVL